MGMSTKKRSLSVSYTLPRLSPTSGIRDSKSADADPLVSGKPLSAEEKLEKITGKKPPTKREVRIQTRNNRIFEDNDKDVGSDSNKHSSLQFTEFKNFAPKPIKPRKEVSSEHKEMIDEIAAFEKNLKNFTSSNTLYPTEEGTKSIDYIKKIRSKKQIELLARQEREKRRRRVLIEQQEAQKAMEQKRRDELMLEKLLKQSQEERRITAHLLEVRKQKELMKQNRIQREIQYAEQRRREFEDTLARDAERARKNRTEYEKQILMEKERFKEYEEAAAKRKAEKHFKICKRITSELLDLALKVEEYKQLNNGEEPLREYLEWKSLFCSGLPLDPPEEEAKLTPQDELLNEEDLHKYINALEDWKETNFKSEGDEAEPKNYLLGKIVDELNAITSPPPQNEVQIPEFPIKAAFIGKTFSGKTSQAKKLSAKFHVTIISTDELLSEAVSAVDKKNQQELPQDYKILAEAAKRALNEGREVDDKVIVGLLVNKIKSIERDNSNGGWILDGFPRTLPQAQLLEKQLSGYEPPHKLSRTKSRRVNRVTTPPPKPESKAPPSSGLDVVVRFDVEDEMVMRRSVGRRIDPQTGDVYHLEFNPPPVDQQLINERLIHADGTTQVPKALLCFGENRQALEEWFHLFGTLKTIDANNSIDAIHKFIENMFMSILDHKAAVAQKKKEEEELKELEQKRIQMEEEIARRDRELKQKMEEERAKEEEKSNKDKVETKKVSQQRRMRHRGINPNEKKEEDDHKDKDDEKKESTDREPDTLSVVTDDSESQSQHSSVPTELEGQSSEAPQEKVLSEEAAKILNDAWNRVESHFLTGAKRAFHIIRKQRDSIILHLAGTKTNFIEFLNRPANFQERVNTFETNFNEIDSDMRDHQETKQELHQRAEELLESLWEMCDKRKVEAEEEKKKVMKSGWIEDNLAILLNAFITLMQLEVDRYIESKQLLRDYYSAKNGQPLGEAIKPVDLPFIGSSLKFVPPAKVVPKNKKKVRVATTNNPRPKKEDLFSELTLTLEKALSLLPSKDEEEEKKEHDDDAEMEKALELEDEILKRRLHRIKDRGMALLSELKQKADSLYIKLDEWLGEKFKREVNKVEKLVLYVKEIIEKEIKLPHLQIDNSHMVVEEEQPLQLEHVDSQLPIKSIKWVAKQSELTTNQFLKLANRLAAVSPNGQIAINELVDFLLNLAGNSVEFGMEAELPLSWNSFDRNQVVELCKQHCGSEKDVVNWLSLLISYYTPDEQFVQMLQNPQLVLPSNLREAIQSKYNS